MTRSAPRPFTAATNKFAHAQAFSAASTRRHPSERGSHALVARGIAAFRGRHASSRHG